LATSTDPIFSYCSAWLALPAEGVEVCQGEPEPTAASVATAPAPAR
jgi:hypothetical protein